MIAIRKIRKKTEKIRKTITIARTKIKRSPKKSSRRIREKCWKKFCHWPSIRILALFFVF